MTPADCGDLKGAGSEPGPGCQQDAEEEASTRPVWYPSSEDEGSELVSLPVHTASGLQKRRTRHAPTAVPPYPR